MIAPAVEMQPEWLRPGDRVRRGVKLFDVCLVQVSVDQVLVSACRVMADGTLGAVERIEMRPGEIVRAHLGDMWPSSGISRQLELVA